MITEKDLLKLGFQEGGNAFLFLYHGKHKFEYFRNVKAIYWYMNTYEYIDMPTGEYIKTIFGKKNVFKKQKEFLSKELIVCYDCNTLTINDFKSVIKNLSKE